MCDMGKYLGEQIRLIREAKGLNQRQFAKMVGVSQAQISLHEVGEDVPSPKLRAKYAEGLGIPLDQLEEIISRERLKDFLRSAPNLSDEAKRSIEDYIDFAWERDRQARS